MCVHLAIELHIWIFSVCNLWIASIPFCVESKFNELKQQHAYGEATSLYSRGPCTDMADMV